MEKIRVDDESGDKKYFTIIPNYILNHSTLWDREVYIQMKRIAGESGTCWTSRNTLSKQCGMSARRLDESLKYLLEHKWIKFVGKKEIITKGGMQQVNEYKVVDLWDMNNNFYQSKGIAPNALPINKGVARDSQRGSTDEDKGIAHGATKEELREEELRKKNIASETLAGELNPLINLFKEVNPTYKRIYANKTERKALLRLVKEFGSDKVKGMIEYLPRLVSQPYAPKITKPTELERDMGKIKAFLEQNKNKNQNKGVTII